MDCCDQHRRRLAPLCGVVDPETEEAEEGEHTHLPSETRQRVQRSGGGENPIFLSLPAAGFGGARFHPFSLKRYKNGGWFNRQFLDLMLCKDRVYRCILCMYVRYYITYIYIYIDYSDLV